MKAAPFQFSFRNGRVLLTCVLAPIVFSSVMFAQDLPPLLGRWSGVMQEAPRLNNDGQCGGTSIIFGEVGSEIESFSVNIGLHPTNHAFYRIDFGATDIAKGAGLRLVPAVVEGFGFDGDTLTGSTAGTVRAVGQLDTDGHLRGEWQAFFRRCATDPGAYETILVFDLTCDSGLCTEIEFEPPGDLISWTQSSGGDFSTVDNWSPQQVPVSNSERSDTAIFDLPANYQVDVGTRESGRLVIQGGPSARVQFNNSDYSVLRGSEANPGVLIDGVDFILHDGDLSFVNAVIGDQAASSVLSSGHITASERIIVGIEGEASLEFVKNSTLQASELRIGNAPPNWPAFGQVIVGDRTAPKEDAPLIAPNSLAIGYSGEGSLFVEGGGGVICETAVIGVLGNGIGYLEVNGDDARFKATENFVVGDLGIAEVLIDSGAGISVDKDLKVGLGSQGHGDMTVQGSSSLDVRGSLILGGTGTANLRIYNGGKANVLAEDGLTGGTFALHSNSTAVIRGVDTSGQTPSPSLLRAGEFNITGLSGSGIPGELAVFDGGKIMGPSLPGDSEDLGSVMAIGRLLDPGNVLVSGLHAGSGLRSSVVVTEMRVGGSANGTLTIERNGFVSCSALAIGGFDSSHSEVVIRSGGELQVDGSIQLGVSSEGTGTARLVMGDPSGILHVAGDIIILENIGEVCGYGNVQIDGKIINSGRVNPGSSPGALTINGDYRQTATGELVLELGGVEPGFDYDQFTVTGTTTFEEGAKIRLVLIDPNPDDAVEEVFIPRKDDVFDLLRVSAPQLPAGKTLGELVEFSNLPEGVTVEFQQEIINGETVLMAKIDSTLPIPAGPRITSHPKDDTIAAGQPHVLRISAESATPVMYQWRLNGEDIPGATEEEYALLHAQGRHVGDYSVEVTSDSVSVTSRIASLAIDQLPTPASLILSDIETSTDGITHTVQGKLSGGSNAAGLELQFESSNNLNDWMPLGTRIADETGFLVFEFTVPVEDSRLFVRARFP